MTDLEWGKIYYCHSCKKYLDDETSMKAHQMIGHQANSFISMPKVSQKNEQLKATTQTFNLKDEIRQDYADLTQDDPEVEFEG